MIIQDEERIERRLNNEENLALKLGKGNRLNHDDAGRNLGDKNLHPVLRSIISAAAQISTAKEVVEDMKEIGVNVSPGHVHLLKHGKVTSTGEVKEEILNSKKDILDEVRSKASDILLKTLGIIPEKLDSPKSLKLKEVSQVAKDMAHILEKTNPTKEVDNSPKILIITAPLREVNTYPTIEIGTVNTELVKQG